MDVRDSFHSPLHALDGRLGEAAAVSPLLGADRHTAVSPSTPVPSPGPQRACSPIFDEHDAIEMLKNAAQEFGRAADRMIAALEDVRDRRLAGERNRVYELAREELRLVRGDAMVAATVGLTIVKGDQA